MKNTRKSWSISRRSWANCITVCTASVCRWIITYEGWDAAGKGGNIKRITEALDPVLWGHQSQPGTSRKGASLPLALLDQIAQRRSHCHLRPHLVRPRNGRASGKASAARTTGNDAYNEINEFEKELVRLGCRDYQILGPDRQRHPAGPASPTVRTILKNSGRSPTKTGATAKNGMLMKVP